jgi:ribosome-associated translation inhibitor RaiA
MSKKTDKVKLNESQRDDIMTNLDTLSKSYFRVYNESHKLRTKFKEHMSIFMTVRLFAHKYGTMDMVRKMGKLYKKFDEFDKQLYDVMNKLKEMPKKHAKVDELFRKYEIFCNK